MISLALAAVLAATTGAIVKGTKHTTHRKVKRVVHHKRVRRSSPDVVVVSSGPSKKTDTVTSPRHDQLVASTVATPMSLLDRHVSLDFTNTDVVQILKALAMQANANIVAAPEVKGGVTVCLDDVSLREALDVVTTLSHARYQMVGNMVLVADSKRFPTTLRQIGGHLDESSEMRIVKLTSGESLQIQTAILNAIPQDTPQGHYDILIPSGAMSVAAGKVDGQGAASGSAGAGASGSSKVETPSLPGGLGGAPEGGAKPAQSSSGSASGSAGASADIAAGGKASAVSAASSGTGFAKKDPYLMIIGTPTRLAEVEAFAKDMDHRITDVAQLGVRGDLLSLVVPVYSGQGKQIQDALTSVLATDPKKDSLSISSASQDLGHDGSVQNLLLLNGPQEKVTTLATMAEGMDKGLCKALGIGRPADANAAARHYEVVDLNSIEPSEAMLELQSRFYGLGVRLMPATVEPFLDSKAQTQSNFKEIKSGGASSGGSSGSSGGSGDSGSGGGSTAGGSGASGGSGGSSGTNLNGMPDDPKKPQGTQDIQKRLGTEPMKLMLFGTESQIADAKKFLEAVDLAPKQVAIELRVMELSKEDALKLGVNWSIATGGNVKAMSLTPGFSNAASIASTFNGGTFGVTATLDQISNKTNLISRPNLLGIDGRPSTVFVGDTIRYIKSQSTNPTTGQPDIQTDVVTAGVTLSMVPRVGSDGSVTLNINSDVSFVKSFLAVPGGGQLPETSDRQATMAVNLENNETIAIGGLIQDQEARNMTKIPILGDLPVLGHFFRSSNRDRTRSEIVMFITVHVVDKSNRKHQADPRVNDLRRPAEVKLPTSVEKKAAKEGEEVVKKENKG